MKKSKKIGVLISILLILLLALGAVSAAEDATLTDNDDLGAIDEVQTVDNTQTTDEINYESTSIDDSIVPDDVSDSGGTSDEEILQSPSDSNDDETIARGGSVNDKNMLKATQDDEPLRAGGGTFTELASLINSQSTINLNQNYTFVSSDNRNYGTGIEIAKSITINGNGYTIDGAKSARIFYINGQYTVNLNNIVFTNAYANGRASYGSVIYNNNRPTVNINNCTFINNGETSAGSPSGYGTIHVQTGTTTVLSSTFVNNKAVRGGAMNIAGGNVYVHGCAFIGNTATGGGNNVYMTNGNVVNLSENWWGTNAGAGNSIQRQGGSLTYDDWFKLTGELTGSTTAEIDFELATGNTPVAPLAKRPATVTIDSGTVSPNVGECPTLTVTFSTTQEGYIHATVDSQTVDIKVFPSSSGKDDINQLDVTVDNVYLPNNAVLNVVSDVDGDYDVAIGDVFTGVVTVTTGQGTLPLTGLPEGQYFVVVSRTNDPDYNDKYAFATFTVSKAGTAISIVADDDSIEHGEQVTITPTPTNITASDITYYVDGSAVSSNVLSGLTVGTHTVVAKFAGNATHNASESNTITITVVKADVTLSVDDAQAAYGETGTVTIHTDVPGYYTVTVGSADPITVKVTGATKDVSIPGTLSAGTHTITVSFDGDENHTEKTATGTYTVTSGSIQWSIATVDPTYPDAGQVTVSSNVDGTYIITINSKDYEVVVSGGQGTVDIDKLDVGTYPISIRSEIEGFDPVENAGTFTVSQGEVDFSISQKDAEVSYGDVANFTATINDDATGTITYYVDGVAQTPVSVGTDFGAEGLSAGTHSIYAKYSGNDNYKTAESNVLTFTVNKASPMIIVGTTEFTYPNRAIVLISVCDKDGNPINGITVRVTVNGTTYAVESGAGDPRLYIEGLNVGEYPITAISVANDNYASATNNTETIVINKADLNIVAVPNATSINYGDSISLSNTITAPEGSVSAGTITYYVDGTAIPGSTVTDLSIGTHNVSVKYSGDPNFNDAESANVSITVSPAIITVTGEGISVSYPNTGNIIINTNVAGTYTIKVGDKTYKDVELVVGDNTFTVADILAVGDYDVKVSASIDNYEELTDVSIATYTVSKGDLTIAVVPNATTIPFGDSVTLSNTIAAPEGSDTTGTVTYYVDGLLISGNTVPDLGVGTHTVVARYTGNNFNDAESAPQTITVNKASPILYVVPSSATYPYNATIVVALYNSSFSGLDGIVKITVNNVNYALDIASGGNFLIIEGLNAGEYPITAVFEGNENYTSVTNSTEKLEISKNNLSIAAVPSATSIVSGDTISFTSEITAPEGSVTSGTVTYYVDSNKIEGNSISDLSVGTHTVVAEYIGDPNFNDKNSTAVSFTVTNVAIVVTGQDTSVAYPNVGNIIINTNVAGTYTIKVGDKTYEDVELVVGDNTFTVADILAVGDYDVKVSADIEGYDAITDVSIASYTVTKGDLSIAVVPNATTIPFGDSVTLSNTIAAPEGSDTTGTVTYYVDGLLISGNTVPDLGVGTHTVVARYTGNNFNDAESAPQTITVEKAGVNLSVDDSTAAYGREGTVTIHTDVNGYYTITVGNAQSITVKVTESTKDVTIPGTLDAGVHTITVSFDGDENHTEKTATGTYTVITTQIQVQVMTIGAEYPNAGQVIVKASVAGDYNVTVGNYTEQIRIAEDGGTYTINMPKLDAGNYNVSVKANIEGYDPVDIPNAMTYTVTPGTVEFNIAPKEGETVTYGEAANVTLSISGDATGTITYYVDGIAGESVAISPNFSVEGLNAGTHTIFAKYGGDKNYMAAESDPIQIIVNKASLIIDLYPGSAAYPGDAHAIIDVFTDDGVSLAGITVLVTVNGATYAGVTNENGNFELTFKGLDVGQHLVSTVSVATDNFESATYIGEKIVVRKGNLNITAIPNATSIPYGDTISFTANITAPQGAVTSGVVKYYVDGNPISGSSISSLGVGTHTVVAEYSGDSNFNDKNSTGVSFTVTKAVPNLSVICNPVTYPENPEINVLVSYKNTPLKDIAVTITVNGVEYSGVTSALGLANIRVEDLNAGNYSIMAVTAANENYTSASNYSEMLVISKANVTITTENVTVTYPETGAVTVTASAPGYYTIKIGDEEYLVNIPTADGSVSINPTFGPGTYGISVTAPESINYNAVDTGEIANYTLIAGSILVTVEDVTVAYPNTGVVNITSNVDGEYEIIVNGRIYSVKVTNGKGNVTIEKLQCGIYHIRVKANIDNYERVSIDEAGTYTVTKGDINISSGNVRVVYPGTASIVITTDAAGTYTIKVGDSITKEVELSVGENTIAIEDILPVGTYTVTASATNIDNYKDIFDISIGRYAVTEGTLSIVAIATPETIGYGEEIVLSCNIIAPEGATTSGTVKYYVDEILKDDTLTGLAVGTYTVVVRYVGDPNFYDAASAPLIITVNKANPAVSIVPTKDSFAYGEDAIINVTVTNGETGVSGIAILSVEGNEYLVHITDGVGQATVKDLASGSHDVTATFIANDNYNEGNAQGTIIVNGSTDATITAFVTDITDMGDVSLDITFTDSEGKPITGKVNITVDGVESQEYDVTEGHAEVTLTGLSFGDHNLEVSSNEYDSNTASVTVGIRPKLGTYTDLQYQIDNAGEILDLTYDFEYDPDYDGPGFLDGVRIEKSGFFTINGNGVTICGKEMARIFYLKEDMFLRLKNVTLCHGKSDEGGAIFIGQGALLRAYDVIFRDNNASISGGAIAAVGDLNVNDCIFINNSASDYGGAIYSSTMMEAIGCTFDGNDLYGHQTSGEYGGAAIYSFGRGTIVRNSIVINNNPSYVDGDMVYGAVTVFGDVKVINVTFSNNKGRWGGAIGSHGYSDGSLVITDSRFDENEAYQGGAVFAQLKNLIVENSNFTQNSAPEGGAIFHDSQDIYGIYAQINGSLFEDNLGQDNLFNIFNGGDEIYIDNSTFKTISPTLTFNDTFVFGSEIPINGTFDWGVNDKELTMYLTINSAPMESPVLNAKFNFTIDTQPDVGIYTVVINTFTDADGNTYVVNPIIKTFEVIQATPTVVITPKEEVFAYGDDVVINVSVKDGEIGITGTVIVTVDGMGYVVDVINGIGQATIKGLENGTYEATAKFIASGNYGEASASPVDVVVGASTDATISANITEPTVDGSATLTVNVTDGAGFPVTGKVNVTIDDGEPVEHDVIDGLATIPITGLSIGDHTVVVSTNEFTSNTVTLPVTVAIKKGTYTDLQYQIDNAAEGNLVLPYDFAFDEEYDIANNPNFYNGVVINQSIQIGGNGRTISGSDKARIFYVNEGVNLGLSDVTLAHGSVADKGAAVYSLGILTVLNSQFEFNQVTGEDSTNGGGAIYASKGNVAISNSEFSKNSALNGGAIYVTDASAIYVAGTDFSENSASYGGAIRLEGLPNNMAVISGSKFEANTALEGGAIDINENVQSATITKCEFTSNKATAIDGASPCGGAIHVDGGEVATDLSIADSVFMSNSAKDGNGGAIALAGDSTLSIIDSEFTENSAAKGGAIFTENGATIRLTSFDENSATLFAGAIYAENDLSLDQAVFNGNEVTEVGDGGAIYITHGHADIHQSNFTGNSLESGLGGAVYIAGDASSLVSGSIFTDNLVKRGGAGAIYVNSPVQNILLNCGFNHNSADYGGAIIVDEGGNLSVSQSTFDRNYADDNAGALLASAGSTISISDSSFTKNKVKGEASSPVASAVYVAAADMQITSSNFTGNSAKDGSAIAWLGEGGTITGSYFADNDDAPLTFNINNLASDLNIEANTFAISNLSIKTDKIEYDYGATGNVSGIFNWGVNDYPIDLVISWTKDGIGMEDIVIENFENVEFIKLVENLEPGVYTVTIKTFTENAHGNKYLIADPVSYDFIVDKGIPTINVTGDTQEYGTPVTVNVSVMDGETGISGLVIVTVNNVDYAVTTGADGKGTVTIADLPVNEYPITAKFVATDKYSEAINDTEKVIVTLPNTAGFDIAVDDIAYGDNLTIVVTNVKDATGQALSGKINGTWENDEGETGTYEFTITDGAGNGTISGLKPGAYELTAQFTNDDGFSSEEKVLDFGVEQAPSSIIVSVENGQVIIMLSGEHGEDIDDTIKVKFDGVDYEGTVTTVDGSATFDLPELIPGNHTVEVEFLGNEYYYGSDDYAMFNVPKETPQMAVEGSSVEYGEPNYVEITVTDEEGNPVNGTVIVVVDWHDGVSKDVVVLENGQGTASFRLDLDGVAPGTYNVTATFVENDYYNSVEKNTTVTVTLPHDVTFNISVDNITYGDNLTIVVTNVKDAYGQLLTGIIIGSWSNDDGETGTYEFAVTDGAGNGTISGLKPGAYELTAKFTDEGDFYSETEYLDFGVEQAQSSIFVMVEGGQVSVQLKGPNGENIDDTVKVKFDGVDYEGTVTTVDGSATFDLPELIPGNHTVEVEFLGNEYYYGSDDYAIFEVPKASPELKVISQVVSPGGHPSITIMLTGVDDEGLNGTVLVTVNGTLYAVNVTDGEGELEIFGLRPTTYPIFAKFEGNDYYDEVENNTSVIIYAVEWANMDIVIENGTYGDELNVIVENVTDIDGNPLSGTVMVDIYSEDGLIDIVNVEVTDGRGSEVIIPPCAGALHANAFFYDENNDHQSEHKRVDFIVDKAEPTVTVSYADGKVTINLDGVNGEKLNETVDLIIDGQDPISIMTENGVNVTAVDLAIGDHSAYVVFKGNDNYLSRSNLTAFNIPKRNATVSITVDPASIPQTDSTTITVSLVDGDTKVDGIVIVSLDGIDYSVNVTAGEGSVTIKNLDPGTYVVSGRFIGNEDYNEANATDKSLEVTKVSKVDLTVTADGNKVIIKLTDEDGKPVDGKVNVTIDGKTQEVNVTNGVATVPTSAGSHNVTVNYAGDAIHGGTKVVNNIVINNPTVKKIGTVLTVSRSKVLTYNKTVDNLDDYWIYVTLKDTNGKLLAGKKVKYSSHGKTITRTTNAKGQIRFNVAHTPKGECNRAISFLGDDKYNASFKSLGIKIVAQKVKLTAKKKTFKASKKVKKLTATIKNRKGKALKNKQIIFIVNGKKYKAKSNKKGVATVKVKLSKKKTYKVKVKFAGDKTYKKATKKTSVKIK